MKKILKISGITLLILLSLLIVLPVLFQNRIETTLKKNINSNLNATLDFKTASLSLLQNFPKATIALEHLSLVNQAPFEGDTLLTVEKIAFTLSIRELFREAEKPVVIKSVQINSAQLHLKIDKVGNSNYDIIKASKVLEDTVNESASAGFILALEHYNLNQTYIHYKDDTSGFQLTLSDIQHSGNGDLSLEQSTLKTTTAALISIAMDSTVYLNQQQLALDAHIGIDLTQNRYTFLDNKMQINQLPLVFDGFVQVNDNSQDVDLTFKTPSSDFKHALAILPDACATSLKTVQTNGNFDIHGQVKGVMNDEYIPTFHLTINAKDAAFQYPNLPKSVQNINLYTEINNLTGRIEDTAIAIRKFSFSVDQHTIDLTARITQALGNANVRARMQGNMNLAYLAQAYPIPSVFDLKGLLKADVTTTFDKQTLKNKQYKTTQTQGTLALSGFEYPTKNLKHPLQIDKAALAFTTQGLTLNNLKGKIGSTDFDATGVLTNFLGFVFNDENMTGDFKVISNILNLSDFEMEEDSEAGTMETTTTATEESIQIPNFFDGTVLVTANSLLYDNLDLKNVTGSLLFEDETAILKDVTAKLLGGTLGLNGMVSTREEISTFNLNMALRQFDIAQSFATLDLLKVVTPLTQAFQGKFNSDISLKGNLKNNLVPNLATLSGNWNSELLSAQIDTQNTPLIATLIHRLPFLNSNNFSLQNLKTHLRFEDGTVTVQPFTFDYNDIVAQIMGSHTFDHQLDYTGKLEIPASYLGQELGKRIALSNNKNLEGIVVPVTAHIGGSYTQPIVKTDLTDAVQQFTTQLANRQKQKFIDQSTSKAKNLLSELLQKKDTNSVTIPQDNPVKQAAKSILGGFLSRDKNDTL